jgi:hypothetical protein
MIEDPRIRLKVLGVGILAGGREFNSHRLKGMGRETVDSWWMANKSM